MQKRRKGRIHILKVASLRQDPLRANPFPGRILKELQAGLSIALSFQVLETFSIFHYLSLNLSEKYDSFSIHYPLSQLVQVVLCLKIESHRESVSLLQIVGAVRLRRWYSTGAECVASKMWKDCVVCRWVNHALILHDIS